MFPIVKKRVLNPTVTLMEIEAPLVARKALPGQFIIFRIDEEGERIPLTIAWSRMDSRQPADTAEPLQKRICVASSRNTSARVFCSSLPQLARISRTLSVSMVIPTLILLISISSLQS